MTSFVKNNRTIVAALFVIAVVGLVMYYAPSSTEAQQGDTNTITWVITHRPISVFDEAKNVFAEEFNKDSDTKISVKLLGPDDYPSESRRLTTSEAFRLMDAGEVQLATVSLGSLYQKVPEVTVFSLPYLFRDTAAVEAVFEGDIGQGLLDTMTERLSAKALAFTFSGGWLVLQSNSSEFNRLSDYAGKKLTTINGSVALDVLGSTGAETVQLDIINTSNREVNESLDQFDAVETVYTRLHYMDTPQVITETNHALFVTGILVDKNFYSTLSERDKTALERAARAAAAVERQDSLELAARNKAGLISRGTRIVGLTEEERSALAARMQSVYAKYEEAIGRDLIEAIRASQK